MTWIPLGCDAMKFNTDRSTLGQPGPIGIRSILRDSNSNAKIIFSMSVGVADLNIVELLVVKKAFTLFANLRMVSCPLTLETDLANMVKWIIEPKLGPVENEKVINEVENLNQLVNSLPIIHTLREASEIADRLAKAGVNRTEDCVLF